jgi:hypothetical protein
VFFVVVLNTEIKQISPTKSKFQNKKKIQSPFQVMINTNRFNKHVLIFFYFLNNQNYLTLVGLLEEKSSWNNYSINNFYKL